MLSPFACIALWRARHQSIARATLVYAVALTFVLSVVLSVVGWRGTYLHSLAAITPLLYAFAPAGLAAAIAWIAQRRRAWQPAQAERIFGAAFTGLALLLSIYFYVGNVFGDGSGATWNTRYTVYQTIEQFLRTDTQDTTSPVMCINPPFYSYLTQRPAIAIPTDDPLAVVHAAQQFGVHYVIVEADHPKHFDALYHFTITDPRFQLRATFSDGDGALVEVYQVMVR